VWAVFTTLPLETSFKLLFIQYPIPAKDNLHAQMRLVPFACDLPVSLIMNISTNVEIYDFSEIKPSFFWGSSSPL
jgi:hypothetical protein